MSTPQLSDNAIYPGGDLLAAEFLPLPPAPFPGGSAFAAPSLPWNLFLSGPPPRRSIPPKPVLPRKPITGMLFSPSEVTPIPMGFFDKLFGTPKPAPAAPAPAVPKEAPRDWESQGTPQDYAPGEVQAMMSSANPPILLDVREDHELAADGFIPGSVHIPMGQVEARLGELDRNRAIVVYCAHGMRSFDVGFLLIQSGFKDVGSLNGGLCNWNGPRERRS